MTSGFLRVLRDVTTFALACVVAMNAGSVVTQYAIRGPRDAVATHQRSSHLEALVQQSTAAEALIKNPDAALPWQGFALFIGAPEIAFEVLTYSEAAPHALVSRFVETAGGARAPPASLLG